MAKGRGSCRRGNGTEGVEGMAELIAGKEGTLEDWIEEVLEIMVGEVEGAEGVVDMIVMTCAATDDQRCEIELNLQLLLNIREFKAHDICMRVLGGEVKN